MTLIRRVRRLLAAARVVDAQMEVIRAQNHTIRQLRLDHVREMHGITLAWLISMETPETDLRYEVAAMEQVLGNQVAALEEHVL
jgi:hypothetical protein